MDAHNGHYFILNYDKIIYTPEDYWDQINAGHGIYRYNQINNPDVYFNENIQRLIQNYRSGFLQLGLQDLYSSDTSRKNKTLQLLEMMDSYFPPESIPTTDPELDIQVKCPNNAEDYCKVFPERLAIRV